MSWVESGTVLGMLSVNFYKKYMLQLIATALCQSNLHGHNTSQTGQGQDQAFFAGVAVEKKGQWSDNARRAASTR